MLLEDFLRQRRGRGRPWLHAGNKKAPLGAFWVARQMMPALSAMVGRDGFEPSTKRLKGITFTL
ncbi:hypothetical protein [Stenotrophomonas lactitubi]|uniref:hypothetical protein n=1 Tax=Stenotrophomonas lactitubi TaxID=2045214 RepID=UPI0010546B46|nr:hypothetical protein [Stenotrophomonas lactitubi]